VNRTIGTGLRGYLHANRTIRRPEDGSAEGGTSCATTRNRDARRGLVIAALGLTMSVAGVRPSASQATETQARDSAGVTIAEYAGSDVELSWTLEPLWTLGGTDEGPAAFFRVDRGALSTDSRGRLYVLDQGNREVRVFTSGGAHVRTFGSEGAGPGELRFPFSLAVGPDGSAGVVDLGKGALVRFDSSGAPLSEVSLSPPYLLDPVYLDERLVATLAHPPVPGDSTLREIVIRDQVRKVV